MKQKLIIIFSLLLVLSSCNSNDESETGTFPIVNKIIELTPEEFLSIAFDNPKELQESEVLKVLGDFNSLNENNTKSRSTEYKFSVSDKYCIMFSSENNIAKKSKTLLKSSDESTFPIYVITMKNEKDGFALVSADERFPQVLAYVENGSFDEIEDNEGLNSMVKIVEDNFVAQIKYQILLKDSLRSKTLDKISEYLGLSSNKIDFNQIKKHLSIKGQSETKAVTPIGTILSSKGPYLNTAWGQNAPYNSQLAVSNCTYQGQRYSTGCVTVTIAQVFAHYGPTLTLGKQRIDWNYLKASPTIPLSDGYRVEQVGQVMKYIGEQINTRYSCSGSSATMENGISLLKRFGINCGSTISGMNVSAIKSSLDQMNLAIVTGSSATPFVSTHSWIMDGYQVREKATRELVKQYNIYMHANFGWDGYCDGYFLVGTDLSLNFNHDFVLYDRNFRIYPYIRF